MQAIVESDKAAIVVMEPGKAVIKADKTKKVKRKAKGAVATQTPTIKLVNYNFQGGDNHKRGKK